MDKTRSEKMAGSMYDELMKEIEKIKDQETRREVFAKVRALFTQQRDKARIDGLTGVLNRKGFEDTLEQICTRSTRHQLNYGLLFIDMDYFKKINDEQGHAEGDKYLKVLAKVMEKSTRAGDILGRYGGDEFVVLLWDTDQKGIQTVGERILKKYKDETGKTLSIGGVAYQGRGTITPTKCKLEADENLYKVKQKGRNGVYVTPYRE